MYTEFRITPKKPVTLNASPIPIPAALPAPPPDKRPIWRRAMPLIVLFGMIGIYGLMFTIGGRNINPVMMLMPLMMLPMMLMGFAGGGGNDPLADLENDTEDFDYELGQKRIAIYKQGRSIHGIRSANYPNPADLTSLIGSPQMWSVLNDPERKLGVVVSEKDKQAEPAAKALTTNPQMRARVGIGVLPLYPRLEAPPQVIVEQTDRVTLARQQRLMNMLSIVPNSAIDLRLDEFPAYVFRGDREDVEARMGLARAMLMSLAFNHRPGDLEIGIITEEPQQWEWLKWLPHTEDLSRVEQGVGARLLAWRSIDEFAAKHAAQIEARKAANAGGAATGALLAPNLLVIVDLPDQVVSWPANMSDGVKGITWLVTRYGTDLVSADKSRILLRNNRVSTTDEYDAATADYVSIPVAQAFAQAMQPYRPRGYGAGATIEEKPDHIPDFFEVLGIADIETHDIKKVWAANAYTDEIRVPFGYMRNGDELLPELSYINFYEENRDGNGPHGAIAGRTGSGKSYFLRAVVLALVAMYGPDKVALILADFKGGATFLGMDKLPHVVASISNLEETAELVERLGAVIDGEVTRREEFITSEKGCNDIFAYREEQSKHPNDPDWPPLPDLIIIIDEFGEFLKEQHGYLDLLVRVGRVGRSLGMHLVMCSQFIDQAVLGDLLNHLSFRYSLAVNSATHSNVMIGTDAAATMVGKKGGLKGKILRRFTTDAAPVEVAAFHHEAPYVKKTITSTGELSGDTHAPVQDPILPFSLFSSRDFTPHVVDGEVIENREQTGLKMANVLLEKIERFEDERVLDLWKPSLREPLSLVNLNLSERETEGLRIRIGDIDVPEKHTRLPWSLDFGGATPNFVVSGAAKSGRTTLLQTLVICGALQHGPQRLAFMAIDYGTGKLSEIAEAPNVAAYARPNDTQTADRILGEAGRLIARRTELMVERGVFSVDDYLKSKETDPVADDAYGYMIILIDGIGGFLGEDRAESAERLIPLLDGGAKVGVHVVYTADSAASSNSGNVPTYKTEVPGNVILPNTDYSGSRIKAEVRMSLGDLIPGADQPGRSVDTVTLKQARTAVPINMLIKPDGVKKGMPVFKVRDYGKQVREIASSMAQALGLVPVPPVLPAPALIDYGFMWDHIAGMVTRDRHPLATLLPLGFRMDTLAVAPTPTIDPARGWFSQNLLVFGEKQSGRTNVLRTTMESVMQQYTPSEAVIYVVDPLHHLLADRDRLYERGFVRPAKFEDRTEKDGSITKVRTRGPGYVTSREDIEELAQTLVRMMAKRRPHDDTPPEDLLNRTFFSGPEVYVFIDNFNALAEGYMHKSPFDEVKVGGMSVASLLAHGTDLGVHFIITDNQKFYERSFDAPLYAALQGEMQTPMLQLAASPQVGQPIRQAYHLKPDRWRPGQGRLIVDAADYVMIQAALMGAAGQQDLEEPAA